MSDNRRGIYPGAVGLAVGALLVGVMLPLAIEPGGDRDAPGAAGRRSAPAEQTIDGADEGGASATVDPGTDAHLGSSDAAAPPSPGGVSAHADGDPAAVADQAGAASTPPEGRGPRAAAAGPPEVGVSQQAVSVGALLFDIASVGRAGFGAPGADAAAQRRYYEAFVGEINDGGGVSGRKLRMSYVVFDALDREAQRRACVQMAEDVKPFAVVNAGGWFADNVLCITEQYGIPLLSGTGESDEVYRRSKGLLFTPEMSASRMAATMARQAHRQGRLRDGTIGVILGEGSESRVPGDGALIPELKRLGYEIAHVTRLSADLQTSQSQVPIEIAEMRRRGVDRVLTVASAIIMGIWFNQAEGQGYRPVYFLSDVQAGANDFAVQSAPASLRAVAYTVKRQGESRRGLPHQPQAADCLQRYQRRTGESVARGSTGYEQLVKICGTVETFARAASAAGHGLTRPRWLAGVAGLGSYAFPDLGGTISFSSTKRDGADFIRTKEYSGECRCYLPVDDFTRAE